MREVVLAQVGLCIGFAIASLFVTPTPSNFILTAAILIIWEAFSDSKRRRREE